MHYLIDAHKVAKIWVLFEEMRKPRHKEDEQLAQAHADKWWSQIKT